MPPRAADSVLARLREHDHPVNLLSPSGERRTASDDEIIGHVAAVWRGLHNPASRDLRRLRLLGIL